MIHVIFSCCDYFFLNQTPFNTNNSVSTPSGALLTFHQRNAHHLHSSSSYLSQPQSHASFQQPSSLQQQHQHQYPSQMQQLNAGSSASVDASGYSALQSQLLHQSLQLHNINLHQHASAHSMMSGEVCLPVTTMSTQSVDTESACTTVDEQVVSPFVAINTASRAHSHSQSRNKNLMISINNTPSVSSNQIDCRASSYLSSSTLTSVSSLSSQYSDDITDHTALLSTPSQSNVDDFDDLKLLDFPFQEDAAYDDTSLDEMFSPTPSSVATFDPTVSSSAPATPTTTCSSSYAPSPVTTPIPFACPPNTSHSQSSNLCNTFQPANDLVLSAVTANASTTSSSSVISTPLPPESPIYSSRPGSSCHTPSSGISVTSSSPISANCLPSFMDAYSTISTTLASDLTKLPGSTMSPRVPSNTPLSAGGHFTHRNDEPYFKFEELIGEDFSVSNTSGQQLPSIDLFSIKQEPLDDQSHQHDLLTNQDINSLAAHRQLLLSTFSDQVSPPKRSCRRVFDSDSLDMSTGACLSSQSGQSMSSDRKPFLLKTAGTTGHSHSLIGEAVGEVVSPGIVEASAAGQINLSLPLSESTQCSFSSTCSSPPASGSVKVSSKETSCSSKSLNHLQHIQSTSSHGSSSTSTSSSSKSHSICAVCGDNAACQHYGVRTCEGCKGFFKRTVQKAAKYTCLGSKDCVVDKRRRNRCQFCRFQKCLSVGMVKEVVRTDELKGRRGRLPSKPKSPQASPPSPPVSTITALVRAHLDTNPDTSSLEASQSSQVLNETVNEDLVLRFYSILTSSFEAIRSFAERIPSFMDLEKEDQETLFHSAALELFSLRFAHRNASDSDRMLFCSGSSLHRSQVETVIGSKWLHSMGNISRILTSMDIDISAFACLSALTIVTERPSLVNASKVEQLQMKIINSLRDHCTYNCTAQKKVNYLSKILNILSELRSVSLDAANRINRLNAIVPMPHSFASLFASTSSSIL